MDISLPPDFEAFINVQVSTGAYSSPQEVLSTALDLLKRREELLAHIDEGTSQLRTGDCTEYGPHDLEKFRFDIASFDVDTANG